MGFIYALIIGLVIGAIAKLLMPGRDGGNVLEQTAGRRQQPGRLQHARAQHRHHGVELERPGRAGPRHRGVVADDAGAHLQHRLGHDRVDLAGHDRRARLQRRQVELAQPGARSRAHPAQVVADLGQADRHHPQLARHLDQAIARRVRLERVAGHRQRLPGQRGQLGDDPRAPPRWCADAGADRGATEGHLGHRRQRRPHTRVPAPHLRRVSGQLLPHGHRRGVHQVGPPGLDHVGQIGGPGRQRRRQVLEGRPERRSTRGDEREVDGGREHVVARLRRVDVVVGMDRLAEGGAGEVGQHLVEVHVRRGARAGLVQVDRELVGVVPGGDGGGGGGDGGGDGRRHHAELLVDLGCGLLDLRQRDQQLGRKRLPGHGEVDERTLGLRAPQRRARDLDRAQAVVFGPGGRGR